MDSYLAAVCYPFVDGKGRRQMYAHDYGYDARIRTVLGEVYFQYYQ